MFCWHETSMPRNLVYQVFSQFSRCLRLVFTAREVTHHTSCSGYRTLIFPVSCRCGDVDRLPKALASAYASSGRYQVIIMQRGPPLIGIPHLVAAKFKLCSGVLYLHALGIPHLAASKFTIIQRKENQSSKRCRCRQSAERRRMSHVAEELLLLKSNKLPTPRPRWLLPHPDALAAADVAVAEAEAEAEYAGVAVSLLC